MSGTLIDCRLAVVRVFVRDWEAAVRFYSDTLGLRSLGEQKAFGWAEFDVGGVVLGLERVAPDDPEADVLVGRFVGISLAIENMDAAYASLRRAGVRFEAPPARQPWGGTLAHLKDPEGNVITLLARHE